MATQEDPCVPEPDFPEYFVVMLPLKSGHHFVFCEAVASFNADKLGVEKELLTKVFEANFNKDAAVAVLPPPGDPCAGWSYFAQGGKGDGQGSKRTG